MFIDTMMRRGDRKRLLMRIKLRSDPSVQLHVWNVIDVTVTVLLQLAPPLLEVKARSAVSLVLSMGTITVPLGCTSGCPPMPVALLAVCC